MNERIIIHLLKEAENIILQFSNKFTDGPEREYLKTNLLGILTQFTEIQESMINNILDSGQETDDLDKVEYDLQREINTLIIKIEKIMKEDIEDYKVKRLSEGKSNATINRELSCLRRMYNLAIIWEDARKNPVAGVDFLEEPPGRTRYLSLDEINRLLDKCSQYIRSIVLFALNTGMRLEEILGLKWRQVYIDNVINPYIEIEVTKNNEKRFIPINDVMIAHFKEIWTKTSSSEYVFLSSLGDRYHHIRHIFNNTLTRANIHNLRFHDLRHTFASHYVMNGGDLLSLKEILGHKSLTMVQRYAHLASFHKRNLINNLNYASISELESHSKESISF
jgi:integrase